MRPACRSSRACRRRRAGCPLRRPRARYRKRWRARWALASADRRTLGGRSAASRTTKGAGPPPRTGPLKTASRLLQGHGRDQIRVAELPKGLALDQAHPLTREAEHLAGLPKRQGLPVLQAVAKRDDVSLALVEHSLHGVADLLAEQRILDLVERSVGVDLLDQVAELGVLAHRGLQGQRLPATHLREVVDLLDRCVEGLRQLVARGLPAHGLTALERGWFQFACRVGGVP